jgi:transmembrane 9 superfamily protein 2/4
MKVALLLCLLGAAANAFYIPGVAPQEFSAGDDVEVKAVKLTSIRNPLPYEYYFLPFCRPEKLVKRAENLGEVLRGDRITNTPYKLRMKEDVLCAILCSDKGANHKNIDKTQVTRLQKFIKQDYRVNMLLDNLLFVTSVSVHGKPSYVEGFPVGFYDRDAKVAYVYNHVDFIIRVHQYSANQWRVVGFEVRASSIDAKAYKSSDHSKCSVDARAPPQIIDAANSGSYWCWNGRQW